MWLDHVLLTLGNLFRIYSDPRLDLQIQKTILGSLEKHWAKADQDVFILAVFLNPYIQWQPLSLTALTNAGICEVAAWVFTHIFNKDPDLNFLKAFEGYFNNQAEFSNETMALDMMKQLYDDQVHNFYYLQLVCSEC